MGLLDLSDADLQGFEPLEPARYNAEVFEITMSATTNEGGKTPVGTPLMKIQFKLVDEPFENRRVFTQFVIPPKGYDAKKAATMKGMVANFFMAIGFEKDEVVSKDFDPDFEDCKGRPCVVIVGKEPKKTRDGELVEGEYNNPVKGVKPPGSAVTTGGGLL